MSELSQLQKTIAETRAKRGFVTDPLKILLMLTEEIGEIAAELKPPWSKNYDDFNPARLQEEIADAFVLLSALATRFNIDLETAVTQKFFQKESLRPWQSTRRADN